MHMGAVVDGDIEVRADRFFRKHDTRLLFEQRHDPRAGRQRRESRSDLRGIQHFVIEMMLARASQAAADHFALRRADHQAASDLEQTPPRALLELPPQFVCAAQQRHVCRVLEVREPDHARAAVTRSLIVGRLELLDAENALAARGGMRGCGAAHAAKADDDQIESDTLR